MMAHNLCYSTLLTPQQVRGCMRVVWGRVYGLVCVSSSSRPPTSPANQLTPQPTPQPAPQPTPQAAQLPPEAYEKSPSGDLFVRRDVAKGILPEILEELLAARKRWVVCGWGWCVCLPVCSDGKCICQASKADA
jgi:hypothetical protein